MKFTRAIYKKNAKAALKGSWFKAILAVLLVAVITSAVTNLFSPIDTESISNLLELAQDYFSDSAPAITSGELVVTDNSAQDTLVAAEDAAEAASDSSSGSPLLSLITIFGLNILTVGLASYFIKLRKKDISIKNLFDGFKSNYLVNVLTMFLKGVFAFLWGLLLVIPGIIKSYQYSMIPYILADNSGVSRHQAFKMTKAMTKGHKWDLFVLDLSFIGWAFLCCLTLGIGFIFLKPYINATMAEVYEALKAEQIAKGNTDFGVPAASGAFFTEQPVAAETIVL